MRIQRVQANLKLAIADCFTGQHEGFLVAARLSEPYCMIRVAVCVYEPQTVSCVPDICIIVIARRILREEAINVYRCFIATHNNFVIAVRSILVCVILYPSIFGPLFIIEKL